MKGQDTRKRINENNAKIQKLLDPARFVLNKDIQMLLNENRKLQDECDHMFRNGVCVYCDLEEDK